MQIKKYTVHLKSGDKFSMVCMKGETIEQAEASCRDRFLDKFDYIEEG